MAIDWTIISEEYKGLWVALKEDEQTVVGSGKTLQEALEEASNNGYDEPIVTRIPEELISPLLVPMKFPYKRFKGCCTPCPGHGSL